MKMGDYRDFIEHTGSSISKQVQRTPFATNFSIVLEASKGFFGPLLLASEGEEQKTLELTDLLPLFDRCKHLTSPNVRNSVTSFKYLRRFGIMDSIIKLRGSSIWNFVQ